MSTPTPAEYLSDMIAAAMVAGIVPRPLDVDGVWLWPYLSEPGPLRGSLIHFPPPQTAEAE